MTLIAIGYNIAGTGLTRVMHSVMRRLADRHEIHYLGIGYSGETICDRGLTIHPTNSKGGDVFAVFQALRLIEEIRPALIFILHDIWTFDYYLRLLGPYRDRPKIAAYIPLDGKITNDAHAAALEGADRVIVYTTFARAQFESAFDRLRAGNAARTFPPVDIVPHGIDLDRFFPLPGAGAKRKVFGDLLDVDDSFVVLNASRFDQRKRVDLTVRGFARFAAGKPASVRLCLHHAIMDEASERQLRSWIQDCGLTDRVMLNPFGNRVVSDEELNLLYSACDVGINTAMGEGWGLVSCEHGATGAAQIVPDHTACAELWRGRGELIPVARRYIPDFSVLEMGEVSEEGVAGALESLYRDPARRHALARAAIAAAHDSTRSWDVIAGQFERIFMALA